MQRKLKTSLATLILASPRRALKRNSMNIAFKAARLAAALAVGAGIAAAGTINILYAPNVAFTVADQTQIQNAVNFYTSNMTSNFTVTIAVGAQAGGGASTTMGRDTASYANYYNSLVAYSSGDATDTAAIASLGGYSTNNPVTGSTSITMSPVLAQTLGVGTDGLEPFSECDNLTANACIQIGTDVLGLSGSPAASLLGTFEHEVDEVLGTSSALPNGGTCGVPANPSAADLFRYSAPGTRGFELNTSTSVPCTGSPTAYFSVDGGATNLNPYNNCNNGGDYGDWIYDDGLQVQDAYGPDGVATSLNLSSPEVTLLDAVGYNFVTSTSATPEPSSALMLLTGLAAIPVLRRRLAGKPRP